MELLAMKLAVAFIISGIWSMVKEENSAETLQRTFFLIGITTLLHFVMGGSL